MVSILFILKNYHPNLREIERAFTILGHKLVFICEDPSHSDEPEQKNRIRVDGTTVTGSDVKAIFDSVRPDYLVQRNLSGRMPLFWREAGRREVARFVYDQDPIVIPTLEAFVRPKRVLRFWFLRIATFLKLGVHHRVSPVFRWGAGPALKWPISHYVRYPAFLRQPATTSMIGSKVKIVCVAKFGQKRKRIEWLIRSLEKSKIPFDLQIVGWNPTGREASERFGSLTSRVEELALLKQHVSFHENLGDDEMRKIYRSADLFVLPSSSEPFAISPLEAMQHGVPVLISSDGGAVDYVCRLGEEAIFRAMSFRSFHLKLSALVGNFELRSRIRHTTTLTVSRKHSFRLFFEQCGELSHAQNTSTAERLGP